MKSLLHLKTSSWITHPQLHCSKSWVQSSAAALWTDIREILCLSPSLADFHWSPFRNTTLTLYFSGTHFLPRILCPNRPHLKLSPCSGSTIHTLEQRSDPLDTLACRKSTDCDPHHPGSLFPFLFIWSPSWSLCTGSMSSKQLLLKQ